MMVRLLFYDGRSRNQLPKFDEVKQIDTVAIVGVGLIGGSIGLALRERRLARRVIGVSRRKSTLQTARRRGAISSGTHNLARAVAEAELIVVCTPVASIVPLVREAAEHCPAEALITDAGSTKAEIVAQLDENLDGRARFLGSHPMAGGEQSGPQYAKADLFQQRTVITTPTRRTSDGDRDKIRQFWSALGANVVELSPTEHDRCVAAVSHLPHLVAAALSATTAKKDLQFAASGWLDTTRVASGDVQLWMEILETNRSHVLKSLGQFARLVADLESALAGGDDKKLRRLLNEAKQKRDSVSESRTDEGT
jgi:prephenate dehydrogenase